MKVHYKTLFLNILKTSANFCDLPEKLKIMAIINKLEYRRNQMVHVLHILLKMEDNSFTYIVYFFIAEVISGGSSKSSSLQAVSRTFGGIANPVLPASQ